MRGPNDQTPNACPIPQLHDSTASHRICLVESLRYKIPLTLASSYNYQGWLFKHFFRLHDTQKKKKKGKKFSNGINVGVSHGASIWLSLPVSITTLRPSRTAALGRQTHIRHVAAFLGLVPGTHQARMMPAHPIKPRPLSERSTPPSRQSQPFDVEARKVTEPWLNT